MIAILFNLATGIAALERATIIKVGADVPVRVRFSEAPGAVTAMQVALGTADELPEVLAFTEDFESENAHTWVALLDASDARLVSFIEGKRASAVDMEIVCVLDGVRRVTANLSVTVQPPIITAGTTSAGGGVGPFRRLAGVTDYTGGGATKLDGVPSASFAAGDWVAFSHATEGLRIFEFSVAATAETSPTFVRCDDADGVKGWKLIN